MLGAEAAAGAGEATVSCWMTRGPNMASTARCATALPVPKAKPAHQQNNRDGGQNMYIVCDPVDTIKQRLELHRRQWWHRVHPLQIH